MQGLRLSAEEIKAAANTLDKSTEGVGKLKPSQIDDLISFFREYLSGLDEDGYKFTDTLQALQDTDEGGKCAKLAACLVRIQDNEFMNGGLAATNANRSGLNYSIDEENFKIFRYAFGLLWKLPTELVSRYVLDGRRTGASSGRVTRIYD